MVSTAQYFALCHSCQLRHPCKTIDEYASFSYNHKGHMTSLLDRDWLAEAEGQDSLAAWDPAKKLQSFFGEMEARAAREGMIRYAPNANLKQAFGGAVTMTVTNLHNLARSVTAGWQSDAVINTVNLFLDALVQINIAQVNSAPANGKTFYLFAGHSIDGGTTFTQPFTGTEGTCTYPDVTANAIPAIGLGTLAHATTNVAIPSRGYSVAATAGGQMPERWTVGLVNDSGLTTAASGNTCKYNGIYATVI